MGVRTGELSMLKQADREFEHDRDSALVETGTGATGEPSALSRIDVLIVVALVVATLAIFWRVAQCDFVDLDDRAYVVHNANVNSGLSGKNARWAFTAVVGSNWHPLTVVSHMLDCQLFELDPAGHHLVNLLLHAGNVVLLYLLLRGTTGRVGASAVVAALFAWHPLHVESVAWVAERKDVLSTCFALLALRCYCRYARRTSWWSYTAALVFFALGLLSKPMVVTIPCVMLLLDYWPLGRWATSHIGRLIVEKVPFFVLAAASCAVTLWVQMDIAVRTLDSLPVHQRVMNAMVSYTDYVGQMVWPARLAVFYPHPGGNLSWMAAASSGVALLVVSAMAVLWARSRPYVIVGWLWYLGMLVPVMGLVQVGGQARADRYTYLPLVGLFVAGVWLAADWANRTRARRHLVAAGAGCLLAVAAAVTWRQLDHWRDTESLFRHACAVTGRNFVARFGLGKNLVEQGRYDAALAELSTALEIRPRDAQALYTKGFALQQLKQWDAAIDYLRRALALDERNPYQRANLAAALLSAGRADESAEQYTLVLAVEPNLVEAIAGLAAARMKQRRDEEAIALYHRAAALRAELPAVVNRLARIYAAHPDARHRNAAEAVRFAESLCRQSNFRQPMFLDTLAAAYAEAGRYDDAVHTAREALRLVQQTRKPGATLSQLAIVLPERIELYASRQPYREDPATVEF